MTLRYTSATLWLGLLRQSAERKILCTFNSQRRSDSRMNWFQNELKMHRLWGFFVSGVWSASAAGLPRSGLDCRCLKGAEHIHPDRLTIALSQLLRSILCKWKLRMGCHAPMLDHHLGITQRKRFLKEECLPGAVAGKYLAEWGPGNVTMVTMAHRRGKSGERKVNSSCWWWEKEYYAGCHKHQHLEFWWTKTIND